MKNYYSAIIIAGTLLLTGCTKEEIEVNDSQFTMGAIEDNTVVTNLVDFPSSSSSSIISSKDLSHLMPPIGNQKEQGACAAFALSYLKSYHERLEKGYSYSDNTKIMSPAFLYNQLKESGSCRDAGMYTIKALNFLMQSGISTESDFPFLEYDCSIQPSSSVKQNAMNNKIKEWKGFDFRNKSDNTILFEMKKCIVDMQPIIIDIRVDGKFTKLGFDTYEEVIWKSNLSSSAGLHTMVIVGYDDSKNAFKVWNSWDTEWGNNGWIWIDYDMFFKHVSKAFVTWDVIGRPQSGGAGGTDLCNDFILTSGTTNIGFGDGDIIFIFGRGGKAPYTVYIDGVQQAGTYTNPSFAKEMMPKRPGHTYLLKIIDANGCEINKSQQF